MRTYQERFPQNPLMKQATGGIVFQCECCDEYFPRLNETTEETVIQHEKACRECTEEGKRSRRIEEYTQQVIDFGEERSDWEVREGDDDVEGIVETIAYDPKIPNTPEEIKTITIVEAVKGYRTTTLQRKPGVSNKWSHFRVEFIIHGTVIMEDDSLNEQSIKEALEDRFDASSPNSGSNCLIGGIRIKKI